MHIKDRLSFPLIIIDQFRVKHVQICGNSTPRVVVAIKSNILVRVRLIIKVNKGKIRKANPLIDNNDAAVVSKFNK